MNFTLLFDWLKLLEPASAPTFVVYLVGLLLVLFGVFYLWPSWSVANNLKQASRGLEPLRDLPASEKLEQATAMFASPKYLTMKHAWKEYADTLHRQSELAEGESRLIAVRATTLSATFFSVPSMVETPLRTEVFKHLPGVLTGIGIVGTFLGLMLGLTHFDVSDPAKVTESVSRLLSDVLYAFVGSSVAILSSILVTGLEKARWGRCLVLLEKLTESIDELFKSGVGEEYLADLVKASNESAVNARQLKDSLVSDLRVMLQNLVDTQVQENFKLANTLSTSYQEVGASLATQIGRSIEDSLKDPLDKIAGSVQQASGDQSGQVQHLLTDLLSAFMSKLDASFGQQFNGLHEMLGQSVTAMQSMQQGFTTLIGEMRSAGESSSQQSAAMVTQLLSDMQSGQVSMQAGMNQMLSELQSVVERMGSSSEGVSERMAKQLEQLFSEGEIRQQEFAENLNRVVEHIQQNMVRGQEEVMASMSSTLTDLSSKVDQMFLAFATNREDMDAAHRQAQAEIRSTTESVVGGLDKQLKETLQLVEQQREDAQRASDTRQQAMVENLDRFIEQIQQRVGQGQEEVMANMSNTLTHLGSKLDQMFQTFTTNQEGMDTANRQAQAEIRSTTESVVGGLDKQLKETLQLVEQQREEAQRTSDMRQQAMAENLDRFIEQIQQRVGQGQEDVMANMSNTLTHLGSKLDQMFQTFATNQEGMDTANRQAQAEIRSTTEAVVGGLDKQLKETLQLVEQHREEAQRTSDMRQQAMVENLDRFIAQIQQRVGQGQEEVMANMSNTLAHLGSKLDQMFQTFATNREGMDTAHRQALSDLRTMTESVVAGLRQQLQGLMELVEQQRQEAQQVIKELGQQTSEHLEQMANGADKMRIAAESFDSAGNNVVQAGETTAKVLSSVQMVGSELVGASRELTAIVAEYRAHRESAVKILGTIESVVSGAQSEQTQRVQLINDLKQHSERMRELNREATDYLDQIGDAMAKGFNDFADGLNRNLVKTMGSLDSELDKAVKGLAGGIDDMKEGIEDLADIFGKVKVR